MHIEKELQTILNHLQPKKVNGNPLEENPNNIIQLDKPPDSGEKKNVKIGKQDRQTRNTF